MKPHSAHWNSFSKNLLPAAFAAALLLASTAASAAPMYTITQIGGIAYGINDRGQVVGNNGMHAFLWDGGVMTDLGVPPGGDDYSAAYGINDRGQVVGVSTIAYTGGADLPDPTHAFLWENGTFTDLGSLETVHGGNYTYARDINNNGQVMGTTDGRSFL